MTTAKNLKIFALVIGASLLQISLFLAYAMNVWQHPLVLVLMIIVPIIMLVRTYRQERNWFNTANQTVGRIIDRQIRIVWGRLCKKVTIEYVLNGVTYKHYAYHGLFANVPKVGENYPLFYDSAKPDNARERGELLGLMLPWIALSFSAILLALTAYAMFPIDHSTVISVANAQ